MSSEFRGKCCGVRLQLSRPDNIKWECSECHKLCEYEYVEVEETASKNWDTARDAYGGYREDK